MQEINLKQINLIKIGGTSYGFIVPKQYVDNELLSTDKTYTAILTENKEEVIENDDLPENKNKPE